MKLKIFVSEQKTFGVTIMNKNLKHNIKKIARNNYVDAVKIKTEFNGLGALKTLLVVTLIILQFSVLVLSYLYLFHFFQWLFTFSFVMSLITCVYVLSTPKNGQTKGTWILFLLICFMFGYIIYFLSDEHIVFRKAQKRYNKIFNNSAQFISESGSFPTNEKNNLDCNYLLNAGSFPTYTQTNMEYYSSGYLLFESILDELKKAQHFIFIEFFIISNGKLLNRVLDILKEKVKNGVDVRIIYDDMGSHGTLRRNTKKIIKNYGIKCVKFNPFIPVFKIAMNFRDHRKIVIIDGKYAFTGGANLADEYVNEKRMYGYWKDCGIKLAGPAVDTFTLAFLRQWEFITKKTPNYSSFLKKSEPYNNNSIIVPFVDGLDYTHSIGKDTYINMLGNATNKICIMTPYFIPDETISDILKNKAASGVAVKLILPEVADKKLVYQVSRSNAEKLLKYGVKLYTMKNSFVHSKIVLTDYSVVVGSINIDQRSFNQQFESAVYTNDNNILSAVKKDFSDTIEKSIEITLKNQKRNNIINRLTAGLFRIISPFM